MFALRFKTAAILFLCLRMITASATGAVATLLRGPYLQQGTANSVIVRWRTDVATESLVRFGTASGAYSNESSNTAAVTEHAVLVAGLQPETGYFYEFGDGTNWFSGTNYFFITAPTHGTRRPTRIWSIGDGGEANPTSMAVRDAYATFTGDRHTDVWLMLGDNAYPDGTDADYQSAVFGLYPGLLAKTFLWPTIGNHDQHQTDAFGNFPYLGIFDLPTSGEAGGLPSGTERYYSFDHANIHFVCLDSMTSDRTTNGPMSAWLMADLEATTQDWIIAYWHHPPYSHGTHNSDTEIELVEMRQNLVPILENHGVDLVLSGHSHSYERSYLIDGHYGLSTTFDPSMKKDPGDGREDGTGAYAKRGDAGGHEGAVYTVAGCAAMGGGASPHPAMFVSGADPGSLVIDVADDRLDLQFLTLNGAVGDHFTIIKSLLTPTNPPAAPSNLVAVAVGATRINLSWADASSDEAGFKIERSINGVDFTQFLVVHAGVTNALDSALAPSTHYTYRLRAYNVVGDSAYSGTAEAITFEPPLDTTPPAAVTNLAFINISSNSLTLSWTAPGDDSGSGTSAVAGYDIRFSGAPIDGANFNFAANISGAPAPGVPGGTQFLNIAGLAPDTEYYFALKSYDQATNISPLSNVADTRTVRPGAPLAPGNLNATPTATNRINLTWIDNAQNEGGFQIHRSVDGTNYVQVLSAGANVTNVADTGLAAARIYYYRVRATNALGLSPFSNGAQATTLSILDTNPPAAVTNLAFTAATTNSATLAWTASGDDGRFGRATRYDLRYRTNSITEALWSSSTPAAGLPVPSAAGTMETVTVQGLGPGVTYYFGLKVYDETNNVSPLSNVPSGRTPPTSPAAPTNLVAASAGSNRIDLVWVDKSSNEDGFQVERATNGSTFVQISVVGDDVTSYSDHAVQPGVAYTYRVRAFNVTGTSAYSNPSTAAATSIGDSGLTVLIASNSVWKYLDNGSDQGTAWRDAGFGDPNWASGPAPLGYGGGIEVTTVGYGPDPNNKYITTYFLRRFTCAGPAAFASLNLKVVRDDGAVVYLNSQEVFRSNMPTGAVNYVTKAAASVNGTDETTFFSSPPLAPGFLLVGTNVAAVEIHQRSGSSSDIMFNLELTAVNRPPPPRLNIVLHGNQVVLLWDTLAGHTYRLQQNTNLNGTAWINVGADVVPAGASASVTNSFTSPGQRFYRVQLVD